MNDDWIMGATAAQDAYQPVDNPWLADVGPPAIGSGGQFSPGVPAVNRAADVLSRYPGHVMGGLLGLPQQVFGASEEMRQGGTYDPGPAVQTALMTMGGGVAGTGPGGVAVGSGPIRAYHSSPHDFERFDLGKIGTGEGAQAYGHGLYFADNPAVSDRGGQYWRQFRTKFKDPERTAATYLNAQNFDREAAVQSLRNRIAVDEARVAEQGLTGDDLVNHNAYNAKQKAVLATLESDQPILGPRTYQVDINADPSHFIDWEKPLREQPYVVNAMPELVQQAQKEANTRALAAMSKKRADELWGMVKDPLQTPGGFSVETALNKGKVHSQDFSDILRSRGIPGIKYLDQGSRMPGPSGLTTQQLQVRADIMRQDLASGKGSPSFLQQQLDSIESELERFHNNPSSNYVVVDPSRLQIVRKYGLAGVAPVGLGALAAQDQYNAQ